jgi:hypothetical protein
MTSTFAAYIREQLKRGDTVEDIIEDMDRTWRHHKVVKIADKLKKLTTKNVHVTCLARTIRPTSDSSLAEPSTYRGCKICVGISPVVSWFKQHPSKEIPVLAAIWSTYEVRSPGCDSEEQDSDDLSCGPSFSTGSVEGEPGTVPSDFGSPRGMFGSKSGLLNRSVSFADPLATTQGVCCSWEGFPNPATDTTVVTSKQSVAVLRTEVGSKPDFEVQYRPSGVKPSSRPFARIATLWSFILQSSTWSEG